MKLVVLTALIAVCGAAKLPTDRSYLPPPPSAKSAGGNPDELQAPNAELPDGAFTNGFQGVIVDASAAGTRTAGNQQSGLGAPRPSYGFEGSKVGEAAFKTSDAAFRQTYDNHAFRPQYPADVNRYNGPNLNNAPAKSTFGSANAFAGFSNQDGQNFNQAPNVGQVQPEPQEPTEGKTANVVRYDAEVGPDSFNYAFETDNGIVAQENAVATNGVQAQGAYSYTGDDGQTYSVRYIADENGYQPQGDHLPTPPPIPEAILRSLEKNAQDEANGVVDDGSYDASKYNTGGDYNAKDNEGKYNEQQYSNGAVSKNTPTSVASASVSIGNQNNRGFPQQRRPSFQKPINRFLNRDQALENSQSVGYHQQTAAPTAFGQAFNSNNFENSPQPFNVGNKNPYSQSSTSFGVNINGPKKSSYYQQSSGTYNNEQVQNNENIPQAKTGSAYSSFTQNVGSSTQVFGQNQQKCNRCFVKNQQSQPKLESTQIQSASATSQYNSAQNVGFKQEGYLPPFGGPTQNNVQNKYTPSSPANFAEKSAFPNFNVNAQSSVGFSKPKPSFTQNISIQPPSASVGETNYASSQENSKPQTSQFNSNRGQVNNPNNFASAEYNINQASDLSNTDGSAFQSPIVPFSSSAASFNINAQSNTGNSYNKESNAYQHDQVNIQENTSEDTNHLPLSSTANAFATNEQSKSISESVYDYKRPTESLNIPSSSTQPHQTPFQSQKQVQPQHQQSNQLQQSQNQLSQQQYFSQQPQQQYQSQQPQQQYQPQLPLQPYQLQKSQQIINNEQEPQQPQELQQQHQSQPPSQRYHSKPHLQPYQPQQQQQLNNVQKPQKPYQFQPQQIDQQYNPPQPQKSYAPKPFQTQNQVQQSLQPYYQQHQNRINNTPYQSQQPFQPFQTQQPENHENIQVKTPVQNQQHHNPAVKQSFSKQPQKFERYQQQPQPTQQYNQPRINQPQQNSVPYFKPQPSSPKPFSASSPTGLPSDTPTTQYQTETTETPTASTSQYYENTPLESNQGPIHEHHSLHTLSPDESNTGNTRYPLPPTVNPTQSTATTGDITEYSSTLYPTGTQQQYTTGPQQYTTGTQQYTTGSQHYSTGTQQYTTGTQHFTTGAQQDTTETQQGTTGTQQAITGTQQATTGTQQATTGTLQYTTGVTQAEAFPFTYPSTTTNFNEDSQTKSDHQTPAEHLSTPNQESQSTILTQEPTSSTITQPTTVYTPKLETNPTTLQLPQNAYHTFGQHPEIQQYNTQADNEKLTTPTGENQGELYHYNKPVDSSTSTSSDADTTAATGTTPTVESTTAQVDSTDRRNFAPEGQFDVQVFAEPKAPINSQFERQEQSEDQQFDNQLFDSQQFEQQQIDDGGFNQAFSHRFNPDEFDQQPLFDFGGSQNYKPNESLSQTFGKGETFGGPRKPPSYDEKTGYHY